MGCLPLFISLGLYATWQVTKAIQTGVIGTRLGTRKRADDPEGFRSQLVFQLCGVGLCWGYVMQQLLHSHISVQVGS